MPIILNIAAYRFVAIADPPALAERVRERCQALELKGTVLVALEGINIFLAGEPQAIREFLRDLAEDARFEGLPVRFSDSDTVPFKRLKVKLRPEIISFRDPSLLPGEERAPTVTPSVLRRWLALGHDDAGRELVLLDTRNRQEVEHGSFEKALSLPIDTFIQLPAALEPHRSALRGKTVVSFCTGGIRCEKAALWMRQAGFDNVMQLEGGILGYFEQVGSEGYAGRCFVFDERVSVDSGLRPL
jgi:UPF0176 protein